MKKIFILSLFLFSALCASKDPFVVVLMVKNEESVINQTLEPYVKAGLNSFLIFDTGSTDKTIETAKYYFLENHIADWHIKEEPFIDFETSRNHALDQAEELFPDAPFFLMPDAEWYLHNVQGLMHICEQFIDDPTSCYLIRVKNQFIDFYASRLIKAKTNARFEGAVHEAVVADQYKKMPRDIYFELDVSKCGMEKSRKRWERDEKILLRKYEENPEDSRTSFYLAQTYECLEDLFNAYKYYEIRSKQPGWTEENYETFYRLGRVTDYLAKQEVNGFSWHMAQDYFFTAHNIMPHRAEPLIRIAEHYWPDGQEPLNVAMCYLFAKRAYELAYPEHDMLFIDPDVYKFRRYELLSKAAWHVGDYALGEDATRKALAHKEMPYLYRNLACYLDGR